MATDEQIERVRRLTGEHDTEVYTDTDLDVLIEQEGETGAIAEIWNEKAARYSDMVDTAEAGARRSLSQLHEHAMKMSSKWSEKAEEAGGGGSPRVSRIVRE